LANQTEWSANLKKKGIPSQEDSWHTVDSTLQWVHKNFSALFAAKGGAQGSRG
jgi:hypothetical protein